MKVEIFQGMDDAVYKYVAPYAMTAFYIKKNGNPITTSDRHKWYVGFDKEERVACFCSVKRSDYSKNMQIGNLFILTGGKRTFDSLVRKIIKDTTAKGLSLMAYANNESKMWFEKLGFDMQKTGINWHNMKYKNNDGL
jgi:N-acetylglutamate synthase-like GNAT family acetyltransferase